MPGYIFADSFGQLGQANLAEENLRQQAFARAMGNLQTGLAASRQGRQFQQQLEEEKSRGKELQTYHMAEVAARQKQLEQSGELGRGYLKLGQDQLDYQKTQPSPTMQRRIDFDFNSAAQDAAEGRFDNPDHVLSMYPTLTEPEANVMATRSVDARRNIMAQHTVASNVADTLNRHQALVKSLTDLGTKQGQTPATHFWSTQATADKNSQIKAINDQLAVLGPKASRLMQDKRAQSMVTYDPESDAWMPAVPEQPWMSQQTTGSGTTPQPGSRRMQMGGTGTAPAGPAVPPVTAQPRAAAAGKRKYSPFVYSRTNELIGQGMDNVSALQRALQEDSAL
jgi:hypothetical protein